MIGEDTDFKGQLKYEHFQFFFRRHWVRFMYPLFFTLPLSLFVFFLLYAIGRFALMVDVLFVRAFFAFTAMVTVIVFLVILFLQVINYYFSLVIVTDARILVVRKTVFLRNDSDAIDLTKIQDFAVEISGLIRNYIGYGDLVITLSASGPPIVLGYVPDPHYYLERCNRVKRQHIVHRQERKLGAPSHPAKPVDYLQDVHHLPI
ncbi:PH domain-containing protein [Candidatus Peregrinibacteria bacterium]|nr:PH domain-containing protein [Candidatus Peregrinibacteria bacterium]